MTTFSDALKKSFVEGFAGGGITTSQAVIILLVTFLIGIYIFFIYKLVNRSGMYDRTFHVAMAIISVITAGIIVAMQSSIVISLGMVGALSIVRFRTAVKNTMDLLFLFWSIGEGIICGAGLFKIAILVAFVTTLGIFVLEYLPMNRKPYVLLINCSNVDLEDKIKDTVKSLSSSSTVKSRNLKNNGFDMIFETVTKNEKELIKQLSEIEGVSHVSLLSHEGEIR